MTAERDIDAPRVTLKVKVVLVAAGALGAGLVSHFLYGGDIVFPALMGGCFGLAVAATGQRRMRTGARDFRSQRVQAFYRDGKGSASEQGAQTADPSSKRSVS